MPVKCSECGVKIWGASAAEICVSVPVLCAKCVKERYGATPETTQRALDDYCRRLMEDTPEPN